MISICCDKKDECAPNGNSERTQTDCVYASAERYYTQAEEKIQSELEEKFAPKKTYGETLGAVYTIMDLHSRAQRVISCGDYLEFTIDPVAEKAKLTQAYFCKDRLCPMCNWRRSLKIFGQVSQVMDELQKSGEYEFLFLTLTLRNCSAVELKDTLDLMFSAMRYLTHKNKRFKDVVLGTFRTTEVTRNGKRWQKAFGSYHPHFHLIIAVRKGYFKSRKYIPHKEWVQLWRDACGLDYDPWVHIQKCYVKLADGSKCSDFSSSDDISISDAVAEASKYMAKGSDYLRPSDLDWSVETTGHLMSALSARRLCSWTGCFRSARQKLALDDVEQGDLIHTDNEPVSIRSDLQSVILRYKWRCGVYEKL